MELATQLKLPTHQDVLSAHEVMQSKVSPVRPTNLYYDRVLSEQYSAEIYIASELHQAIGGYKIRGAYNWYSRKNLDGGADPVTLSSAGTHAKAGAYLAKLFGTQTHIFMPTNTPESNIARVRKLGGEYTTVELTGHTVDQTILHGLSYAVETGSKFLHPFDDPDVVAGKGSIAIDIRNRVNSIDAVFTPAGGCGLAGGLALGLEGSGAKLYACEPEHAASLTFALNSGEALRLPGEIDTLVDGASVPKIGDIPFAILSKGMSSDDVITVSNQKVRQTTKELWHRGIRAEFAATLAIGGLQKMKDQIKGQRIVCVVTGGGLSQERYNREVEMVL